MGSKPLRPEHLRGSEDSLAEPTWSGRKGAFAASGRACCSAVEALKKHTPKDHPRSSGRKPRGPPTVPGAAQRLSSLRQSPTTAMRIRATPAKRKAVLNMRQGFPYRERQEQAHTYFDRGLCIRTRAGRISNLRKAPTQSSLSACWSRTVRTIPLPTRSELMNSSAIATRFPPCCFAS